MHRPNPKPNMERTLKPTPQPTESHPLTMDDSYLYHQRSLSPPSQNGLSSKVQHEGRHEPSRHCKGLQATPSLVDDCQVTKFPWRLHEMLEDADVYGFAHVVSWLPGNKSFKVHQPDTFTDFIMPRYFRQTKFKSFRRQINMWSFKRIGAGPEKGGYRHDCFIRGRPNLCIHMKRTKVKGYARPMSQSPLSNAGSCGTPAPVMTTSTLAPPNQSSVICPKHMSNELVLPLVASSDISIRGGTRPNDSWYKDHEALLWTYACHAIDLPQKSASPPMSQDEIRNELISTFTF